MVGLGLLLGVDPTVLPAVKNYARMRSLLLLNSLRAARGKTENDALL